MSRQARSPSYALHGLRPHAMQAYRRAGVASEESAGAWVCRFDRGCLWAFYLLDVLAHEIGHHADRRNLHKNDRRAERFAEWFALKFGGGYACRGTGRTTKAPHNQLCG